MPLRLSRLLLCLCLILPCSGLLPTLTYADEKQERIEQLQEKMTRLKEQLAQMQEEQMLAQSPQQIPWQLLAKAGEERAAYRQYAYLLAPGMRGELLDDILQQIYHLASQDPLEKRATLFVVPAQGDAPFKSESTRAGAYQRSLAGQLLGQVGIPRALDGGLLIAEVPLERLSKEGRLLFIDLKNTDQILRARIYAVLQQVPIFAEESGIGEFVWQLMQRSAPRVFSVYQQQRLTWLTVGGE